MTVSTTQMRIPGNPSHRCGFTPVNLRDNTRFKVWNPQNAIYIGPACQADSMGQHEVGLADRATHSL